MLKTTKLLILILTFISTGLLSQNKLTEKAQPIVEEGKLLYRSEMASWYGTDLFIAQFQNKERVGGYFSYTESDSSKCIFFSNSDTVIVLGTITFDETYNLQSAQVNFTERKFTKHENDLYQIRNLSLQEINSDTLFKQYDNTNLNIIPLIHKGKKKVYVLTGPKQNGVVIFGNDYLLTFNKKNKLLKKTQLHHNIIAIEYGVEGEESAESAIHSHNSETGDYITATDICTLMLYSKFANWKNHTVVSQKYMNIWNCETNSLAVITMDVYNKINDDQEKRRKKGE